MQDRVNHEDSGSAPVRTQFFSGVMSLTPWVTTADVYFFKICGEPYIFAKSR
jgi:hypothetical protein